MTVIFGMFYLALSIHLVSCEVKSLEPVVAPEGTLLDVGDVVVGQVQLHQDLEMLERVAVYLLKEDEKCRFSP